MGTARIRSRCLLPMEKGNARVAFALLCGLAVCCSVMYITADGAEETTLAEVYHNSKAVPRSVHSEDVQKAAVIVTNTPDGRMRLKDYLSNVEKEIAAEEAARKRDVELVRAQMARNFAFNKAARKKLKAALLKKMASNAKAAQKHLHHAMRWVQHKFAHFAAVQNRRQKIMKAQSMAERKQMARDKAEAAKQLKKAVAAQQTAMATLKQKMHARIRQTDKNIAKNAAQIVTNAKEAHKALERTVAHFDQKVKAAAAGAKAGRSKLAAQLKSQDKAVRAFVANKMKVVIMRNAAMFAKIQKQMAEDRAHADRALAQATGRMTASLNTEKALRNKQFASTVKNINKAKLEAKRRVKAMKAEFNSKILSLRATINNQVSATNARIQRLSGQVEKNRLAQAKVNANVEAEMTRMLKVGNQRYQEHLKKDKELHSLINKNQRATEARMKQMTVHYVMQLDAVRATMRKNRAHASKMLAKKSASLYDAIAKSEAAQSRENKKLEKMGKDAKLQIADDLRNAKADFSKRLGALASNVAANDKKFEKKLQKLTGIVPSNRKKSQREQAQLRALMAANKAQLTKAVADAVRRGENRMMKVQQKLSKKAAKTKAALSLRITEEISQLQREAHSQIEGLHLQSKKAREEMRAELLQAVRDSAKQAKKNLAAAAAQAKKVFDAAAKKEAAAQKKSAAGRAALKSAINREKKLAARQLADSVASLERSMLALKTNTRKAIGKTNAKVSAYADQINKQKRSAKKAIAKATRRGKSRARRTQRAIKRALRKARKDSDRKFAGLYIRMAKQRKAIDGALSSSVSGMNAAIAKQSALADARFSKTVKDIASARANAKREVKAARKNFATKLAVLKADIKDQETLLSGEVAVVATLVKTERANQLTVNRRVEAEQKRILGLVNKHHSESKRARGAIRKTLDEYKRAASEEVQVLQGLFDKKIKSIRRQAAHNSAEAAKDLSLATKRMYGALAKNAATNRLRNGKHAKAIKAYAAVQAAALKKTKKKVEARLNQLTNVMAANARKQEKQMEVLTGVIRSSAKAAAADRQLIREQTRAMGADINKRIVRAIQTGEARAKRVAEEAATNLKAFQKSMLVEIAERVEKTADDLFKAVQGNHQTIADNYLSLKAYAIAAEGKLDAYIGKGKGKYLSSLGDVLSTIANLKHVPTSKAEGISAGAGTIPAIFSSKGVPVKKSVSKINGLVNEYAGITNGVRMRWPLGLGKYLLSKLMESMLAKGVLQVDKIEDKEGNWVFLNGHAVGLSNKMNDFENLAVGMKTYERVLAKLTAALTAKGVKYAKKVHKMPKKKPTYYKGSEWQGS